MGLELESADGIDGDEDDNATVTALSGCTLRINVVYARLTSDWDDDGGMPRIS